MRSMEPAKVREGKREDAEGRNKKTIYAKRKKEPKLPLFLIRHSLLFSHLPEATFG